MIQNESKNETEARRFLLGEMSESERLAFEQSFMVDAGLFEQIRVVEDELIESYVRRILPLAGREKFERSFLTTKRRRKRVEFARVMLDKLSQQERVAVEKGIESAGATRSVWESIAAFCKTPQFALGAVFAVLLLVVGGWFLLRTSNKTGIAKQSTPTPTIQNIQTKQNQTAPRNQNLLGNNPDNNNAAPNVNREAPEKDQNSNRPPMLALFAGTVRAEGKLSELNLPKSAASATLQLHLESEDYKDLSRRNRRCQRQTPLPKQQAQSKKLKNQSFRPRRQTSGRDYLVKLSAFNPRHENESVADYPFRVNRQ